MDTTASSDVFELRHAATDRVITVTAPPRRLLSVTGFGPPRSSDFAIASTSLAAADASLREGLRRRGIPATTRPAVEVLWTPGPEVDPADLATSFATRTNWRWEQLIAIPAPAESRDIEAAIDVARRAAGRAQPLLRRVTLAEGVAIQLLQLGGPSSEAETLARLLAAIREAAHTPHGPIHQVLLSGVETIGTERQRSILRVPIVTAPA